MNMLERGTSMSLFMKNRVSVKKEIKGNNINFFVDYHRLKNPSEFRLKLIRDLMAEKHTLVVIDTNFIYKKSSESNEEEISKLIELLDEHNISYRKVTINKDANLTILGVSVKLNNAEKVKNYIVGFIFSGEDLEKIKYIIDKLNAYYYIGLNLEDTEELLNKFYSNHGDMQELKDMFEYNIFNNNFLYQIKICSRDEKAEFIQEALQKTC
jgi:hypothetical protein